MSNVTDLTERKLDKTNEKLVPLYRNIALLEEELRLKVIELHKIESELHGDGEAAKRQLSRKASRMNW